jgi:hypothetical protein
MVDVREDILARLLAVVATIPNIRSAHRNKAISDDTELPTVIVYDGDEEASRAPDLGSKPPNAPTVMHMTPEIVIAQEADEIGSDLTTFRRELIKLVLYDVTLNEQIVKTGKYGNGIIRYLGCETNISSARSPYGALLARFMFGYSLKPDDL